MQPKPSGSSREEVIGALAELIDALDRRVSPVERVGEGAIAREAAALRKAAVNRAEELRRAQSNEETRDTDLADAAMTDDGGPRGQHGK
jgi:hypothetical protein